MSERFKPGDRVRHNTVVMSPERLKTIRARGWSADRMNGQVGTVEDVDPIGLFYVVWDNRSTDNGWFDESSLSRVR
jgi:hypothetical protein